MKNIKVLAIGGCHVAGFGLQDQRVGFVDLLISSVTSDQITVLKKIESPVSLKKFLQKTNNIHEFSPDVLLIQLGNYEFTFGFKNQLYSSLNIKQDKKKVVTETSYSPHSSCGTRTVSLSEYRKIWLKSWLKIGLNTFVSFINKNLQKKEAELGQFMNTLDQLNYNIILMSPLPVLDEFVQKTRDSASKVLRNHDFKNQKIRYIDSKKLVPKKRMYFQDLYHLNEAGHFQVANKLQSIFQELCGVPSDILQNELNNS